jgi:hypothetical protein
LRTRQYPELETWPLAACLGPVGALPTAPRVARAFTVLVLGGWGLSAVADSGELVVSEFAGNVIRAADGLSDSSWCGGPGRRPVLKVRLASDLARLRIEVWDDLPAGLGGPVQYHAAPDEESGRGLELVEALSLDWGWERAPGRAAKRVWAVLAIS